MAQAMTINTIPNHVTSDILLALEGTPVGCWLPACTLDGLRHVNRLSEYPTVVLKSVVWFTNSTETRGVTDVVRLS